MVITADIKPLSMLPTVESFLQSEQNGPSRQAEVKDEVVKAWMSYGGAVQGTIRASSIAWLPLVPRKWVEMAVVPTQVKV